VNDFRKILCLAVLPMFGLAGCGNVSVDPRITQYRQQFELPAAPDGVATVQQVRKVLTEAEDTEEPPESADVVIRGRITGGDLPPWEDGKSAFMLTDMTGHGGDGEHDPYYCKFCSERIDDYRTQVSFTDADGKLINIDTRELLDVKERDLILIQGKATVDSEGMLHVNATGFHKPQPATDAKAATN